MTILHIDTDTVDAQGRSLLRQCTDMLDRVSSLRYSVRLLQNAWQGEAANNFSWDIDRVLNQVEYQVRQLDELSRRTNQEVNQWLDADAVKGSFTDYFDFSVSKGDVERLFVGGYLATHLRWSPLRPNSMIMTGPNAFREWVGIKGMTRVIKPGTLVKQMALLAYAENVAEGFGTARDTFFDPRYAGTTRAVPAAVIDGVVKTAILAAGTTALVIATGLISTISAPVWVVGGAIIGTWVVGGFLLDKMAQTPAWEAWQKSYVRDQAIEWGTQQVNEVKNFFQYQVSSSVQNVKQAFGGFVQGLLPSTP